MKKLLLATTALVAFAAGAQAADLGSPRSPVAAAVVAPAFNWTGFYLGAFAGGASSRLTTFDRDGWGGGVIQTFGSTKTGFLGGANLGYNWQFNNAVIGVEGSLGYLDAGQRRLEAVTNSNTIVGVNGGLFGDLTGRLGVAVDRALLYVKGGAAFYSGNRTFTTQAGFNTLSNSRTYLGWTLGAGVEYAVASNWTVRAEYQYYDFGRSDFTLDNGNPFRFRQSLTSHTFKLGVNYLFSTGPSAVTARY